MTQKERNRIADELEMGAENIFTGSDDFCCYAIRDEEVLQIFYRLFKTDAQRLHGFHSNWFKDPEDNGYAELRNRRVLGLLLCAHLVRKGEWE